MIRRTLTKGQAAALLKQLGLSDVTAIREARGYSFEPVDVKLRSNGELTVALCWRRERGGCAATKDYTYRWRLSAGQYVAMAADLRRLGNGKAAPRPAPTPARQLSPSPHTLHLNFERAAHA